MMKKVLSRAIAALFGAESVVPRGRSRTCDVAFPFRMGSGSPGEVNRTHPAAIEPCLIDDDTPPTAYGQFVLADSASQENAVRPFAAADASDSVKASPWGMSVRPYPIQQAQTSNDYGKVDFGSVAPPTSGVIDVLRAGYGTVKLNDITATPGKGDPVYIWCAVTSGVHVQGGVEVVASSGNTVELDTGRYTFNGTPDANGVVEVCVNV